MSLKQRAHRSELYGYPMPRRPITFDPRQEPGAGKPHAGICAGGGEQSSSLPRPFLSVELRGYHEFLVAGLETLMASPYADTVTTWLDWQKPYRFGVLLILPPEPVRSEINALRSIYDPRSHAGAEAHISLTVPFPREPHEGSWRELERKALGFSPFPLRYGPLVPFLPRPGAALDIAPQAELDRLRSALEACEIFQGAGPRAYPFWAHMTIAEFISAADTEKLVREIGGDRSPTGSFLCDHVSQLVPDESFRFREVKRLALGPEVSIC